jgi:hypothetical protein
MLKLWLVLLRLQLLLQLHQHHLLQSRQLLQFLHCAEQQ